MTTRALRLVTLLTLPTVGACASKSANDTPFEGNQTETGSSGTAAGSSTSSTTASSVASSSHSSAITSTGTASSSTATASSSSNTHVPSTSDDASTTTSVTATETSSQQPSSETETDDSTSETESATSSTSDTSSADTSGETTTSGGAVVGSPGCGKGGRPNGGKVYTANVSWLQFPEGYDGETPMPVLFGFHGCGQGNRGDASRTEYTDLTSNNVLGQDYVVAVPISSDAGGCWTYNTDIPRVRELYETLVNDYCVDTERVFATGHSSGAQFIVQILQGNHSADAELLNFKGMAPVAASAYGHSTATAVMYIQGQNDTVRNSDGKDVVDDFVAANGCSQDSTPYEGVDGCQSGGTQVDPGCIEYSGCEVPTVWCSHNDPQYDNTSHGVPCFAAQAMDQFFKSL